MIVGQPGSGKSTLARLMGEKTDLPVIHVDRIHHLPGWVERPREEKIAMALAEQITLKSPSAIRAAKRLIGVAQSSASLQDVLLAESREQAALIGKPHQMEVIAAQFGKRTPKFG